MHVQRAPNRLDFERPFSLSHVSSPCPPPLCPQHLSTLQNPFAEQNAPNDTHESWCLPSALFQRRFPPRGPRPALDNQAGPSFFDLRVPRMHPPPPPSRARFDTPPRHAQPFFIPSSPLPFFTLPILAAHTKQSYSRPARMGGGSQTTLLWTVLCIASLSRLTPDRSPRLRCGGIPLPRPALACLLRALAYAPPSPSLVLAHALFDLFASCSCPNAAPLFCTGLCRLCVSYYATKKSASAPPRPNFGSVLIRVKTKHSSF
jgi:hypothetical protein